MTDEMKQQAQKAEAEAEKNPEMAAEGTAEKSAQEAETVKAEAPEKEQCEETKAEEKQAEEAEVKDPLKEVNDKLEQTKDQLLRLMAEFDNYRKRTTKEKDQSFERGERCVVEAILPIIDNFERAIAANKDQDQNDPFFKGIQMTYDELIKALSKIGVQQLDDLGKTFDPAFHEAMQRVEDENAGDDEIVAVFRKGYVMNGTLLRASLVKVAN